MVREEIIENAVANENEEIAGIEIAIEKASVSQCLVVIVDQSNQVVLKGGVAEEVLEVTADITTVQFL